MATLKSAFATLRKAALAYPSVREEFPWGDRVVKVRGKIFVFLGFHDGALHFTAKLPHTSEMALSLPWVEPTGYGLGKAGWVSATFEAKATVPVPMLLEWLDESYRAVAPKKLVDSMAAPVAATPARRPAKRPAKRRKSQARK